LQLIFQRGVGVRFFYGVSDWLRKDMSLLRIPLCQSARGYAWIDIFLGMNFAFVMP